MRFQITLETYLKLGGKLENVCWSKSQISTLTPYHHKKIDNCTAIAQVDDKVSVTFTDGKNMEFDTDWIYVQAKIKLDEKYL